MPRLFDTVLVANRGEIACRVLRTLKTLGIRSVAVYSDADADARHMREADTAVRIGPAASRSSYLDVDAILAAARATGASAIHPGYGFLSENAALARACAAAGIVFVGPGIDALEVMGDKIRARERVGADGVPVIPGISEPGLSDDQLCVAAERIGFPLMVKPSAGGGGKGMRVVPGAGALPDALSTARRIARSAFGDDTLLLERLIAAPRHIEVQVLADNHGTVLHLGERECSLQRRHQKVIEEAPSPLLDAQTRVRIGAAACAVARSVDYRGAGTVEFLVSAEAPDEFFFLEMNARLQVEHPVTELVTGVDIVEQQLRIAAGERLALDQASIVPAGHAIEARVYAERPRQGFLPSTGRVLALAEAAGDGIRVDSSLLVDLPIPADYDPLLSKLVAWGKDRSEALERLDGALAATVVLGVHTNIEYLRLLLAEPSVRSGDLDTGLIERRLPGLRFRTADVATLVAAAAILHADRWVTCDGSRRDGAAPLWRRPTGWRVGDPRPVRYSLGLGDLAASGPSVSGADTVELFVLGTPDAATVTLRGTAHETRIRDLGHSVRLVEIDGVARRWSAARDGADLWLGQDGFSVRLTVRERAAELADSLAARNRSLRPVNPEVRSPMPGTVVAVGAASGDRVAVGHPLVTVEAMKMEHALLAPVAGVVTVTVKLGDLVRLDQLVATVEKDPSDSPHNPNRGTA